MLSRLFGIDRLARSIDFNQGKLMSELDNLKREVSESVAQNGVIIEALNNLRSDVATVKQQLADAIANGAKPAELQALADQLDAAQTAAAEALANNNVPNPTDPVQPVDPAPVDPTPVEPAPVEPAPVEPAPVDPAPVEPAPVEPAPVEPTPVEPAPVDPFRRPLV